LPVKKRLLLVLVFILILVLPGCGKKETKPNILLITVDTLRRDYLGLYGCPLNTSPFIDQLAKDGVVFKNTITPLPLTDGSHASILSSLHPLAHNLVRNSTPLDEKVETIAEVLQKNGYYTIGAVAVFHLKGAYKFSQGFDAFSDTWDKNRKPNEQWHRVAQSVNEDLFQLINEYLEKQKEKKKPLFIWVHYYDPHTPYINWKHIVFKTGDKKEHQLHYKYAKEVRYTDDHIKELYRYLEEKGLAKELITCITADHGEQLGEHGAHAGHWDFYSENTFVPLIFHGFKIPQNKIVEDYVSTMDIAATLLGRLNLDFEKPGHVHGFNLLDTNGNPKPVPGRDFLIIGDPTYVRSIQWIGAPFSYIMNFDFLYKHWFVSRAPGDTDFPEIQHTLKPVPEKAVHTKYFKKSDTYLVGIKYPYKPGKGLYYGVLKFDVKKDHGFSVGYQIGPGNTRTSFGFKDKKPGTVTITAFFPITPLDYLQGVIQKKKETEIANLKYALLSKKELLDYLKNTPSKLGIEVENRIFKVLKTPRKRESSDELFNLEKDFEMTKNLLEKKDRSHKVKVVAGKKAIYDFLTFYLKEKKKILGKTGREKPLTEEEKKMLKSLGYL
jgi:arylsulfatase A-like enzyme